MTSFHASIPAGMLSMDQFPGNILLLRSSVVTIWCNIKRLVPCGPPIDSTDVEGAQNVERGENRVFLVSDSDKKKKEVSPGESIEKRKRSASARRKHGQVKSTEGAASGLSLKLRRNKITESKPGSSFLTGRFSEVRGQNRSEEGGRRLRLKAGARVWVGTSKLTRNGGGEKTSAPISRKNQLRKI